MFYSRTSGKWPPIMSSLGDRLRAVVALKMPLKYKLPVDLSSWTALQNDPVVHDIGYYTLIGGNYIAWHFSSIVEKYFMCECIKQILYLQVVMWCSIKCKHFAFAVLLTIATAIFSNVMINCYFVCEDIICSCKSLPGIRENLESHEILKYVNSIYLFIYLTVFTWDNCSCNSVAA